MWTNMINWRNKYGTETIMEDFDFKEKGDVFNTILKDTTGLIKIEYYILRDLAASRQMLAAAEAKIVDLLQKIERSI
ncbi:hypothetical protein Tco_1559131, partial [Tanacetum coccineum]